MSRAAGPSRFGVAMTLLPAVVCLVSISGNGAGFVLAIAGTLGALVGVERGRRLVLGVGVAGLFASVLVAGVAGYDPTLVAVAGSGAVLTWDIAEHAIGIARQLGTGPDRRRLLLAHTVGSTIVAVGALAVVLVGFSVTPRDLPLVAVVLLLAGLLALVPALKIGR
ncbi:hypothetical protein Hrd1104_01850 [Halorhabdus sp. CBA1104]|uniref:DUF7519 family protein n=1 Tax=unclassified Halorhabdus TaxID=2621901 RepID=UPI0012B315C5|nr:MULTISPECIES: hypothetical protein [unclassified Halorhabdus]QGN06159.1 hypothetical protein Hrd1104_01850 [Halorhabdus sp. CBA1104]